MADSDSLPPLVGPAPPMASPRTQGGPAAAEESAHAAMAGPWSEPVFVVPPPPPATASPAHAATSSAADDDRDVSVSAVPPQIAAGYPEPPKVFVPSPELPDAARKNGSHSHPPRTYSPPQGKSSAGPQAVPVPVAKPASRSVPKRERTSKEKEEAALDEFTYKTAPPWLISAGVHMAFLIVLGLLWVGPKFGNTGVELDAEYADQYAERLGDQLLDDSVLTGVTSPDHADHQMITPLDLPPVNDPFATPAELDVALDGTTASTNLHAPTIGLALAGRETGMRQSLLGAYGGTKLSEEAVQRGLEWLARQQRKDGSWSLTGPYKDGAFNENEEAATAMALLAFQGNGHTHRQGQFQKNVKAGIEYLLKMQDNDGNFYQGNRNEWMYTQGQCTIVVCELYAMSKDSQLRLPAEKAVKYCVEAQDKLGGWRYRPRMDSDTSVTGWVVMALQSARMAGIDVPSETFQRISGYLDRAAHDDGSRYGYQPGQQPDEVMTAEALLCRQYLGWNQYDPKLVAGVDYISAHLPNWPERNVYYWYYGTQVMHHMQGEHWKKWNGALRDMLIEHQETAGAERGSWNPKGKHPDAWAVRDQGGRLYVTCLSIYMLEVYYRHLPLYSKLVPERGQ